MAFDEQRSGGSADDPHGLKHSAGAMFTLYSLAKRHTTALRTGAMSQEDLEAAIVRSLPLGPFNVAYVRAMATKLTSYRGHGANSLRFNCDTLAWFRQEHTEDADLTAGLALAICASHWWHAARGAHEVLPGFNPPTTADLDQKLKAFGFLQRERRALIHIIQWTPRPRSS